MAGPAAKWYFTSSTSGQTRIDWKKAPLIVYYLRPEHVKENSHRLRNVFCGGEAMLTLTYLVLSAGLIAWPRQEGSGRFLQGVLLGLGLLVLTSWHSAFILLGLTYFGQWDLHQRLVPARLFDGWCLVIAATTPELHWAVAASWLLGLGVLSLATAGIGSADVLAIAVLALGLNLTDSLLLVLAACLFGLAHYLLRSGSVPLLFHLHLAYLLLALITPH